MCGTHLFGVSGHGAGCGAAITRRLDAPSEMRVRVFGDSFTLGSGIGSGQGGRPGAAAVQDPHWEFTVYRPDARRRRDVRPSARRHGAGIGASDAREAGPTSRPETRRKTAVGTWAAALSTTRTGKWPRSAGWRLDQRGGHVLGELAVQGQAVPIEEVVNRHRAVSFTCAALGLAAEVLAVPDPERGILQPYGAAAPPFR